MCTMYIVGYEKLKMFLKPTSGEPDIQDRETKDFVYMSGGGEWFSTIQNTYYIKYSVCKKKATLLPV